MTHWPWIHFGWLIPTIFLSFALGMLLMAMMVAAKAGDKRADRE